MQTYFDEEDVMPDTQYSKLVEQVSKLPGNSVMEKLDKAIHEICDPAEAFIMESLVIDRTPITELADQFSLSRVAIEEVKNRALNKLRDKIRGL